MSVEEKYKYKNSELQKRIQSEIEDVKKGINKKSVEQLQGILIELKDIFDIKGKQLSFPRCIVDSWDYSDKLGLDLLDLAELYKRWK